MKNHSVKLQSAAKLGRVNQPAVGGKGEYIQFVGSLTSASHMQWTGAAEELQKTKYPDMKLYQVLEWVE